MRVSFIGPLVAWCHGLLHCHQFEAQQMMLAAAALVQLGLHGSAPQIATMTKEEKNSGRKEKDNSHFCQIRKQF